MKILRIGLLLLLSLVVNPLTNSASAQQPSAPKSSASEIEQLKSDLAKVKKGFASATNEVGNLQEKLKASEEDANAARKEAEDAKHAVKLSISENEALRRAIDAGKLAEDALGRAAKAEEQAAEAYKHRAESAESRVDKLQDKLSSSRKHSLWAIVGAFIGGALLH